VDNQALMRRALRLARRAEGEVGHYPLVGALVVKAGRVAGQGYFQRPGEPHAEVKAIAAAGTKARGATLVLNLEPCCHWGRTPPCTDTVIRAGIRRVVAGMTDPNPKVAGNGFRRLRQAGLEVVTPVLEPECRRLNEVFVKFITTRLPFVVLKVGATLDGKIATRAGESRWITGATARREVHRLRAKADAVMVGAATVMRDDPELTARVGKKVRHPRPVVVDEALRISPRSRFLRPCPRKGKPIVATTRRAGPKRIRAFAAAGAEVLVLRQDRQGRVDVRAMMRALGEREIASVLLEGGAELNASMVAAGLVDKVIVFVAPKLLGGWKSRPMIGGQGPARLRKALPLSGLSARRVGEDLMLTAYVGARHAVPLPKKA
jgi:diaminohydroxyphosphoribosylaminopyrimidine deaminase/5-amino-6-(5-phosphoribosylamino)uracil reductase